MRRDRGFAFLPVVLLAAALLAACSDDDPAEPGTASCGELVFDDILPTDETGEVVGSGGLSDWCWPSGGSDPAEPYLYPAYPNPFNPTTTIQFALPQDGHVHLRVVNDRCRLVRTLVDARRQFGTYQVVWNGLDEADAKQADGLYGVILTVGDSTCEGVVELRSAP